MADVSSPGVLSTAGFYRRWLGPQLARDEGVDAEQLSQTALRAPRSGQPAPPLARYFIRIGGRFYGASASGSATGASSVWLSIQQSGGLGSGVR